MGHPIYFCNAAAVIFVAEPNSSRIFETSQPAEYFFGAISAQTEIKATAIENQNKLCRS